MTAPPGRALSAIVTGINTNVGLSRSFIGVQAGGVMTVPPTTGTASGLLGWTHFGGDDGVTLLPAIGVPKNGSTGFTPPLPAGQYTFWINETLAAAGLSFDLDFHVQAITASNPVQVPIPLPMVALAAMGLAAVGARRQRH